MRQITTKSQHRTKEEWQVGHMTRARPPCDNETCWQRGVASSTSQRGLDRWSKESGVSDSKPPSIRSFLTIFFTLWQAWSDALRRQIV